MSDEISRSACGAVAGPCCNIRGLVAADAAAQQVSTAGGEQVAPGVRRVEHGKREAMIPGYKSVWMVDIVYQPKAKLASGIPDAQRHGLSLPGRRIAGQAIQGDGICRQTGRLMDLQDETF